MPKKSAKKATAKKAAKSPNKKQAAPAAGPGRRAVNPKSSRGIRRIDTPASAAKQTHGFQVCKTVNGSMHTRFFSDARNGGEKGARKAADAHLATLIA